MQIKSESSLIIINSRGSHDTFFSGFFWETLVLIIEWIGQRTNFFNELSPITQWTADVWLVKSATQTKFHRKHFIFWTKYCSSDKKVIQAANVHYGLQLDWIKPWDNSILFTNNNGRHPIYRSHYIPKNMLILLQKLRDHNCYYLLYTSQTARMWFL